MEVGHYTRCVGYVLPAVFMTRIVKKVVQITEKVYPVDSELKASRIQVRAMQIIHLEAEELTKVMLSCEFIQVIIGWQYADV
jgi:hypothetical protein